jgi:hypothetical protein
MLVALQNRILELPQVRSFIRSTSFYQIGGEDYVKQVRNVSTILDYLLLCCVVFHCFLCFVFILLTNEGILVPIMIRMLII